MGTTMASERSDAPLQSATSLSLAPPEAVRWRRTAYREPPSATRDSVTDLYSREAFEETLVEEFKRAARRSTVVGVLFLEISESDGSSDDLAAAVARKLSTSTRSGDFVASYAANQFCVIANDTSPDGIPSLAHRLRGELRTMVVEPQREPALAGVRIAAVCCVPNRSDCTFDRFLHAIDEAILAAKSSDAQSVSGIVVKTMVRQEDETQLRAVDSLLFSRFLMSRNLFSREELRQAARKSEGPAYCIGRLARELGWISPRRLRRTLDEQRRTRETFSQSAIRLRYLRPEQVFALLAIQRENPQDLADVLVRNGSVDEPSALKLLREYSQLLRSTRIAATA